MGKGPSVWGWGLGGGSYFSLGGKGRHSAKVTFAESEGMSDADILEMEHSRGRKYQVQRPSGKSLPDRHEEHLSKSSVMVFMTLC